MQPFENRHSFLWINFKIFSFRIGSLIWQLRSNFREIILFNPRGLRIVMFWPHCAPLRLPIFFLIFAAFFLMEFHFLIFVIENIGNIIGCFEKEFIKGQLISTCFFGIFNLTLLLWIMISRYLMIPHIELKAPNRHLEINPILVRFT
jgi:hypothetical protein